MSYKCSCFSFCFLKKIKVFKDFSPYIGLQWDPTGWRSILHYSSDVDPQLCTLRNHIGKVTFFPSRINLLDFKRFKLPGYAHNRTILNNKLIQRYKYKCVIQHTTTFEWSSSKLITPPPSIRHAYQEMCILEWTNPLNSAWIVWTTFMTFYKSCPPPLFVLQTLK